MSCQIDVFCNWDKHSDSIKSPISSWWSVRIFRQNVLQSWSVNKERSWQIYWALLSRVQRCDIILALVFLTVIQSSTSSWLIQYPFDITLNSTKVRKVENYTMFLWIFFKTELYEITFIVFISTNDDFFPSGCNYCQLVITSTMTVKCLLLC